MTDTTDKKLLELAAKAAGIKLDGPAGQYIVQGDRKEAYLRLNEQGGHSVWCPLHDSGDALNLAVRLLFSIERTSHVFTIRIGNDIIHREVSAGKLTAEALLCRAIVRAAASLAKEGV